jgi:hypothetical protein
MLANMPVLDNKQSPCCVIVVFVLSGEVRVVGCTSADKYRKFIEKDPGLERRFQVGWHQCFCRAFKVSSQPVCLPCSHIRWFSCPCCLAAMLIMQSLYRC